MELRLREVGEICDFNRGRTVLAFRRDLLGRYRDSRRVNLEYLAQVITRSGSLHLFAEVADGEGLCIGGRDYGLGSIGHINRRIADYLRGIGQYDRLTILGELDELGVVGDGRLDLCIQGCAFLFQTCDILSGSADCHTGNDIIKGGSCRFRRDAALRQDEGGEHLVLAGHGGREGVNHTAVAGEQALDRVDIHSLRQVHTRDTVDILQCPDRRILGIGIGYRLGLDEPVHTLVVLDHGVVGSAGAADLSLDNEVSLSGIPAVFRRSAFPLCGRAEQTIVKRLRADGAVGEDGSGFSRGILRIQERLDIGAGSFKVCGYLVDVKLRLGVDAFGILADVLLLNGRADLGDVVRYQGDSRRYVFKDHALQRLTVRIGQSGEFLQRQLDAVLIVAVEAGVSRVVKVDLGQRVGGKRLHHEFGHLALLIRAIILTVDPFVLDLFPGVILPLVNSKPCVAVGRRNGGCAVDVVILQEIELDTFCVVDSLLFSLGKLVVYIVVLRGERDLDIGLLRIGVHHEAGRRRELVDPISRRARAVKGQIGGIGAVPIINDFGTGDLLPLILGGIRQVSDFEGRAGHS